MSDTLIEMQREISGLKRRLRDFTSGQYTGTWTAYTPTWTASMTNPVLGDGALTGVCRIIGKDAAVQIQLVMGSTTTFGSGEWYLSLPVTSVQVELPGVAWAWRGGYYVGIAIGTSPGNKIKIIDSSARLPWSSTVPAAWAEGDHIEIRFDCRIA